jgi:hypothetical protein
MLTPWAAKSKLLAFPYPSDPNKLSFNPNSLRDNVMWDISTAIAAMARKPFKPGK